MPKKIEKTQRMVDIVKEFRGKIYADEIGKKLGIGRCTLSRLFPGVSFAYYNKFQLNKKLTKDIINFYEKFGIKKTRQKYPGIKLRSVIERYPRKKNETAPF